MPYQARRPELIIGTSVGSGQCVALVEQTAHAPPTHFWHQGDLVRGNVRIGPGTVIATFDPNGLYGNHTDGTSHAAIYLGQDENGIQVIDQWVEHRRNHKPWAHHASRRTILFGHTHGQAVDNADNYHVIR